MDEDLAAMTREQLIAEPTETAQDTRSAGITWDSGASCPRRPTPYRRSRRGRSFSGVVSGIVNRSTSSYPLRPAPTHRIGRDRSGEPQMSRATEHHVGPDRRPRTFAAAEGHRT